jgi:uncharacterized protein (TIGR02246 family)
MPHLSISTDESEVRALIEEWRSSIAARDLDRLMKLYAPDVVFFDAVPPYMQRGAEAYRRSWEAMLSFLPPRLVSEMRDLEINVSGDLATMHCIQRLTNADTNDAATCGWVRVSVIYKRTGGNWQVTHEHVSVPFDPATSQAAFIHKV